MRVAGGSVRTALVEAELHDRRAAPANLASGGTASAFELPNLVVMATAIQAGRRFAERLIEQLPPDVRARVFDDESPQSPDVENPGVHAAPWTIEWYPDEIYVCDANSNTVCRTAAVPSGGPFPDGVREEWLLPLFRRIRMLPELGGGLKAFLEDPTEERVQALRRLSHEYESPSARDDEMHWLE